MRVLPKPTDEAELVFLECISKVSDDGLKQRLTSVSNAISQAASRYDRLATNAQLYTVARENSINNVVSADEMKKVYTYRMAKKGQPGRSVYDRLLAMPPHGICPLCGQRTVSTLDHFLAKTNYPRLVVTPVNLIAACSDCNKERSNRDVTSQEEQTLHPYYDDVTGHKWLFGEVLQGASASIRFLVNPPTNFDPVLIARIRHHFSTLKLAALYASHAGSELVNQKMIMERLFAAGGVAAVQAQLEDMAASYSRAHINSWQSAMYTALAENPWYCGGGFRNVA